MESVTVADGRTVEEPGPCFLVQMKSGAVTSTWVDTCAHMVGMVAQEGISSGPVEVGMDGVGKAHGTWVGTLLEVDGRAPCTDGDADADADADADGETSFLGLKESEIQTDSIVLNRKSYSSLIGSPLLPLLKKKLLTQVLCEYKHTLKNNNQDVKLVASFKTHLY